MVARAAYLKGMKVCTNVQLKCVVVFGHKNKPTSGGNNLERMSVATFIEDVLNGDTTIDKLDDYVHGWHSGAIGEGLTLPECLGMTWEEYAEWVQKDFAIVNIITNRYRAQLIAQYESKIIGASSS